MKAKYVCLFAVVLAATGCGVNMQSGPVQHETRSIPRDKSDSAHVNLRMGGGDLQISGGAQDLMSADFNYNVAAWKPEVRYDSTAGVANLTIEQSSTQTS